MVLSKIVFMNLLSFDSSSKVLHQLVPGPALMSSTELTWRCCLSLPNR